MSVLDTLPEEARGKLRRRRRPAWMHPMLATLTDEPFSDPKWLFERKLCVNEQEFVIGGYTDPKGTRIGLGALVIGYYDRGKLQYAGKVGTGYDEETLRRLHGRLAPLRRSESPFAADRVPKDGVHWVTPRIVVQVGFTEWTSDGRLRHPRFMGERRDKKAQDVVRER